MIANDDVRVALWGIGTHAWRNLIPAFERSKHTRLVAVHSRSEAAALRAADVTGARPFPTPQEMLGQEEVDVVYVSAATGAHESIALEATAAGKHVWCEKPMTTGFESSRAVLDAAAERGLIALEADVFLHHQQFRELRRSVDSSDLGPIRSITARFGFPHRSESDFRYSSDSGGGALLDAGFYPVAASVALLGPGLELRGASMFSDSGFDVDTGGTALLESVGRTALLDWGFGRSYRNEIEVWCQHGMVTAPRAFSKPPDFRPEIVISPQSGKKQTIPVEPADHFALMLDDFALATSSDDTSHSTEILERARLLSEIKHAGGDVA